jgi:hypothetical protein
MLAGRCVAFRYLDYGSGEGHGAPTRYINSVLLVSSNGTLFPQLTHGVTLWLLRAAPTGVREADRARAPRGWPPGIYEKIEARNQLWFRRKCHGGRPIVADDSRAGLNSRPM